MKVYKNKKLLEPKSHDSKNPKWGPSASKKHFLLAENIQKPDGAVIKNPKKNTEGTKTQKEILLGRLFL